MLPRLGAVAFWDVGDASEELEKVRLHHDVGAGLRFLVPQVDPYVMRIDVAVPLDRPESPRLTFGFFQGF